MSDLDVTDFLSNQGTGTPYVEPPPPEEIVITPNGKVRQAGSDSIDGQFIRTYRKLAESSLYFFCKAILGFNRLTNHLHLDTCKFVQRVPPYRKLILLPRDCFKSTIVAKGLPLHIFIQPQDGNCYFPSRLGSDLKGLLICEIEPRASKHLQFIQAHLVKNQQLRALWPHAVWKNPQREARVWNAREFVLPRQIYAEQSDASLQGIGVGTAITGAHIDFMIKDDLISIDAMNSPTTMEKAREYHYLTRPLLEDIDTSLEWTIGTRWHNADIYQDMLDNDPTIEKYQRSLIEDGKIIFPEEFSWQSVEHLKKTLGPMFALLYQNDPRDSELTDFREEMIRWYDEEKSVIVFPEDPRDGEMLELMNQPRSVQEDRRGWQENTIYDAVEARRDEHLRGRWRAS